MFSRKVVALARKAWRACEAQERYRNFIIVSIKLLKGFNSIFMQVPRVDLNRNYECVHGIINTIQSVLHIVIKTIHVLHCRASHFSPGKRVGAFVLLHRQICAGIPFHEDLSQGEHL